MMEAPPGAALVMAEADFLLEFLIVALDAPAQLGEVDQGGKRHVTTDGREPEFRGCSFVLGPFDQQRLFSETRFALHRRHMDAHPGKARPQSRVAAFPPHDGAPGLLGQTARQGRDADAPWLRFVLAHLAHFDGRYDGRHIAQPQFRDRLPQRTIRSVTRIHQHDTGSYTRLQSRADLLQRNLRFGLEPDRGWTARRPRYS